MASQETREGIILLGQNLFFMGRVETVAEPLGYQVHQAQTEAGFWQSYDDRATSLVLVDLEGNEDTWVAVLAGLQQRLESAAPPPEAAEAPEDLNGESAEGVRIVAFGPHEDLAAMERARGPGLSPDPEQGPLQRHPAGNNRRRQGRGSRDRGIGQSGSSEVSVSRRFIFDKSSGKLRTCFVLLTHRPELVVALSRRPGQLQLELKVTLNKSLNARAFPPSFLRRQEPETLWTEVPAFAGTTGRDKQTPRSRTYSEVP